MVYKKGDSDVSGNGTVWLFTMRKSAVALRFGAVLGCALGGDACS